MSRMIFDRDPHNDNDLWTAARLADELFLNLASVKEKIYNSQGRVITVHKYYHQARVKIYRITISGNLIPFVIHLSDLTKKVKAELDQYYREEGQKGLALVLKLAVCKLFENLDFEYTHMSVMKHLNVRMMS